MKSKRRRWIAIHGIWVCDIDRINYANGKRVETNLPSSVSHYFEVYTAVIIVQLSHLGGEDDTRALACESSWVVTRGEGLVEATSNDQSQKYSKSHFGNHIIRVWIKTVTWSICRVGCIGSGSRIPRESCTFSTPYPKKAIPPLMNGHITWNVGTWRKKVIEWPSFISWSIRYCHIVMPVIINHFRCYK